MKIVLTAESADVLARVEGMRRWAVAPTMTRGAKKAALLANQNAKPNKGKGSGKGMKVSEKSTDETEKKEPKDEKKKEKKSKSAKVLKLDVQEISQQSFRRQTAGRENIGFMMKKIHELDTQVFDPFGVCRLKFEGSEEFRVYEIMENAPKAIEFLHLSLF